MQPVMRAPVNAENTKREKRETSQLKAESVSIRCTWNAGLVEDEQSPLLFSFQILTGLLRDFN